MERNKGKIITVTSTKGGVGKTITTLNLAGVFSNLKKKVLVIDFDLYGGAVATYLNSKNDKTIFNLITDLSNNKYKNIDDYIYNHNEYISILSAPKDPRFANKMDSKYIPIILNNVVYKYDVILIDTTHILNEINIYTLDMSDMIARPSNHGWNMHATVSAFPYHPKFDANPIMHDMHIMIRNIGDDDDDALILLLLMIYPKMMVRRRKRSEVRI